MKIIKQTTTINGDLCEEVGIEEDYPFADHVRLCGLAISYITPLDGNPNKVLILHNTNGPALKYRGEEYYYVFGVEFTKEDFHTPGLVDAFILEHS